MIFEVTFSLFISCYDSSRIPMKRKIALQSFSKSEGRRKVIISPLEITLGAIRQDIHFATLRA